MKYLVALPALAFAACNPAKVDPGSSDHDVASPVENAAQRMNTETPLENRGFYATGTIRCVTRAGWATRDCAAGVVRNPDGSIVVTVFHPEGRSRDILFGPDKRATGIRTAEADGSDRQPFSARHDGDVTIVRLGAERYEIPDEVIDN